LWWKNFIFIDALKNAGLLDTNGWNPMGPATKFYKLTIIGENFFNGLTENIGKICALTEMIRSKSTSKFNLSIHTDMN